VRQYYNALQFRSNEKFLPWHSRFTHRFTDFIFVFIRISCINMAYANLEGLEDCRFDGAWWCTRLTSEGAKPYYGHFNPRGKTDFPFECFFCLHYCRKIVAESWVLILVR